MVAFCERVAHAIVMMMVAWNHCHIVHIYKAGCLYANSYVTSGDTLIRIAFCMCCIEMVFRLCDEQQSGACADLTFAGRIWYRIGKDVVSLQCVSTNDFGNLISMLMKRHMFRIYTFYRPYACDSVNSIHCLFCTNTRTFHKWTAYSQDDGVKYVDPIHRVLETLLRNMNI